MYIKRKRERKKESPILSDYFLSCFKYFHPSDKIDINSNKAENTHFLFFSTFKLIPYDLNTIFTPFFFNDAMKRQQMSVYVCAWETGDNCKLIT